MSEEPPGPNKAQEFIQRQSDQAVASMILGEVAGKFRSSRSSRSRGRAGTDHDEIAELIERLRTLRADGIDPGVFEASLSATQDRYLKRTFGFWFLGATIAFTIVSYAIVIFNAILHWEIDNKAIVGLIIETPLQFFGLLYVIANNLFPGSRAGKRARRLAKVRRRLHRRAGAESNGQP